jgi:hypothetical protein
MIKEAIKSIKEIFIPKSEFIEEDVQCAIDDDVVDCTEFKEPYIGVPAPDYLPEDPWFPSPVLSEKQLTVKEAQEQAILDNQILADESGDVVESSDIHQKMYEIATKGSATTLQLDPPGGSENFQEGGPTGPGGWTSGTGIRQFH